MSLVKRSLQSVWHPCTQMKVHERFPLLEVSRAQGVWLYGADGRRYLDAVSSWWVNLFGHANPRINAALRDQLETLEHVMLAGFTHEPVVRLSERLAQLTGYEADQAMLGHCFYASDGASAVEIALKMSFHFWRNSGRSKKQRYLALSGSYHGETMGALAVTDVAIFKDAYAPLLHACDTVPSPDPRFKSPQESASEFLGRCIQDLESYLESHHASLAAFIVEPLVQCATGMAMYDPAYLRHARALCDRYDVHLIADEIAVGFGRTGTMFACEQAGIRPDFLCLSKGLSGGYLPLSVVMTTDRVYDAFYDDEAARGFLHSHSYTGNALACTAALATLDIFEADDVIRANGQRALRLDAIAAPLRDHAAVEHFRRTGMIWAFDARTRKADFARAMHAAALDRELLLRPIGRTVYFMPPYVVSDDDFTLLVKGTLGALEVAA